jgi:protein-S-isoprenylcysteine O-methyltransferase Ste14
MVSEGLNASHRGSIVKSRDHAGVFVPPPLIYLAPFLAAAMLHARRPWPVAEDPAIALMLGGFCATAIGVAIGMASVYGFQKAHTTILPVGRPTTAIVQRGPYGFTRNPMYLAMAIAYFGLSLLLNSLWALVLLPAVVGLVDLAVIRREERYLAAKFGHSYRQYCARVRRWL